MRLIDELIGGQWSQKIAKSLNEDVSLSNLASFQHFHSELLLLFNFLAPKYDWDLNDLSAWEIDLGREPKNTIDVLRALKLSWVSGSYGVLNHE